MAGKSLYEVEQIIEKRGVANSSRVEYLVRWKGYSKNDDTWEPLSNLSTCLELVRAFNTGRKRTHSTSSVISRQSEPLPQSPYNTRKNPIHTFGLRPKRVIKKPQQPWSPLQTKRVRRNPSQRASSKSMDDTSERLRSRESTLIPKQFRLIRRLQQKRGRSSSPAPRCHTDDPRDLRVDLAPISAKALQNFLENQTPAILQSFNKVYTTPAPKDHEYFNSPFSPSWREKSPQTPSGSESDNSDCEGKIETDTVGPPTINGYLIKSLTQKIPPAKFITVDLVEKNILHTKLSLHRNVYILQRGLCTEIVLSNEAERNMMTPEILNELTRILDSVATNLSSMALFSSVGDFFCSGFDLNYFMKRINPDKNSSEFIKHCAVSIRDFVNSLIDFPKPIVAVVQGPAIGLGCAMLPHFDTVYASERAYFATPYTEMGQTPDGCSSYILPRMLGHSLANDMLLNGTTLTAQEAKSTGLISGVYLHDSLKHNVIPLLKHMTMKSRGAMMTTKELIRNSQRSRLKHVNQCEYISIKERWTDPGCVKHIQKYLAGFENK